MGLSLRHNFSWNFVGNVVYAACQWGMLVVLAKLTSPEQVGLFALGLAVTAPIFLFSQLQLRGVQATDACDEYQFGHYLALRLATTLAAFVVLAAVLGSSSYDRTAVLVILAVALSKAFESIADVFYGLLQRHERMDRIARSRIIKGPLALALLAIIVHTTGNVAAGALGMAVAWGLVLVLYDLRNAGATLAEARATGDNPAATQIYPIFQTGTLARLACLALPLGIVMALTSLKTNIPRYFIENYSGLAALGQFGALYGFILLGSTIMQAMAQTFTPRYAIYYHARNKRGFVRLILLLMCIGGALGIGMLLVFSIAGKQIVSFVLGDTYVNQKLLMLMIIAGAIQFAFSIGGAITAMRYIKTQVPIVLLSTGATLLACSFLVPAHGTIGAAYSLILGNAVRALLLSTLVLHGLFYKFNP